MTAFKRRTTITAGRLARGQTLRLFSAIFCIIAGGHGIKLPAQTAFTATVDPGFVVVTNFEGWGTSLCWWANVCGGYANRDTYAAFAFSQLKLNIVRYNIGGGENPNIADTLQYRARMQGFEPANGVWNWSADANQRWMLREAVALGANRVVAFANSPPWWMTVSGSVTGAAGGTDNLQTGCETNFAAYLATVVSNLTRLDGVSFDLVTPMNEPLGSWWGLGGGQEGCHMSAGQQARVVSDLRLALNAQYPSAGIDASEDNDEQSAINSIDSYGSAQTNLALVASHTYGANNPTGIANLAASLRTPAWVSEYGDGDGTGMTMARRIHDDIAGAWVRAWIYWQVVDSANGWGLLYNPLDGSGNSAYTINKKYFVMGQFSQYIRPGCQILNVNDNYSLAAYNPAGRTLVIVAVNDTTNNLTANYNLAAFASLPAQVSGVRTSPTENQAGISLPPVAGKMFTVTLIPESVTTFILNNVTAAAPGSLPRAWYPFEGNARDASGHGNDGALSGVSFVPGKLGAFAAQFNGSNSFVRIPLIISNNFTISFWLRTTNSAATGQWWAGQGLVDGEVAGAVNDFGVSLVGSQVALGIGNPDTTIITASAVNDGRWHHIAATRDAVSGQMLLYLDGTLQADGYGPVGTRTAPPALRVGGIQAGYSGGFFNGTIDDVQLFDHVFAASEIPQLMNHPPAITSPSADYSVLGGRTLVFTNTATDADEPAQTLTWSLIAPAAGASINASNGVFSWRPAVSQSPTTNVLTITVADNGSPVMTATQRMNVTVDSPARPTLADPACNAMGMSFDVSGDLGPDYVVLDSTNLQDWRRLVVTNPAAMPFHLALPLPPAQTQMFYRLQLE